MFRKTSIVLPMFLATSMVITGCANQDVAMENSVDLSEENSNSQILTDNDGKPYQLTNNGDGTETVIYEDGRNVRFQKDEDGNLHYRSGDSSLLTNFWISYMLFHSMRPTAGYYDAGSHTYRYSTPPTKISEEQRRNSIVPYVPSGATLKSTDTYSSAVASKGSVNAKTGKATPSVKSGTVKSGFGSAGVRSATS